MMVGDLVSFQAKVLALDENGDVTVCLPNGECATFEAKELTVNTDAAPVQSEEPVQCSAGDEAEDAAVAAGATSAPPPAETAEDEAEAEVEAEAEAEAAPAWPAAAPAPTAPGPEGMLFQAIEMVTAVPPHESSSDSEEAEAKAEVEAKVEEEEEEDWCSAPGLLALLGAGSFVALPRGQSEEAEAAEEEEEDEAQ